MDLSFYKGKRVFVTGHTGFKGSWLCKMLTLLGAEVTGYSLEPPTDPNLFSMLKLPINSVIGDIRDYDKLKATFDEAQPEIVFHLAAQPIVRVSYKMTRYTYDTNVMGTVNVLECIKLSDCVNSFVNVTTDKVYENEDLDIAFTEDMKLDGYDPYSNSKSCSELVTHSYQKSFLNEKGIAVSTARAGNVIGGGDFASDRIIPDCVRAVMNGEEIIVRNPASTRPFQHVLEPLFVYLLIAMEQCENRALSGYYNVGPDETDCISAGEICDIFCSLYGDGASWKNISEPGAVHEAGFLRLDTSKVKATFGWKPVWNINTALEKVVEWTKAYADGGDVDEVCTRQIYEFLEGTN